MHLRDTGRQKLAEMKGDGFATDSDYFKLAALEVSFDNRKIAPEASVEITVWIVVTPPLVSFFLVRQPRP
jgi:hypothetical protein